jgi:hypothetical protein
VQVRPKIIDGTDDFNDSYHLSWLLDRRLVPADTGGPGTMLMATYRNIANLLKNNRVGCGFGQDRDSK